MSGASWMNDLTREDPPSDDDYGFAQFVNLPLSKTEEIVGVIYNSLLVNPEYANFGPRLSPKPELGNFSPDYLNEQGFLIGILLLGTRGGEGKNPTRRSAKSRACRAGRL